METYGKCNQVTTMKNPALLAPGNPSDWRTMICHSRCEQSCAPGSRITRCNAFCGHRPLLSVKNSAHLE